MTDMFSFLYFLKKINFMETRTPHNVLLHISKLLYFYNDIAYLGLEMLKNYNILYNHIHHIITCTY